MTVADVWGRLNNQDSLPISRVGNDWLFNLPSGAAGDVVCEIWAQDDAGNIAYRAAIVTVYKGTIKCWRWLTQGTVCTMVALSRPHVGMEDPRREVSATVSRPALDAVSDRPACTMHPHICPIIGGI